MLLNFLRLMNLLLIGGIVPSLALDPTSSPAPLPLGRNFETFRPPVFPDDEKGSVSPKVNLEGEFTLSKALALALLHNPELAGFAWEVRIQESVRLQSGLRSNPEVSVDVEDFGVGGSHAGFGKSQTTLRLGQRIELGGKRSARINAASYGADKAGWEFEAKRLEILKQVSHAYIDVVVAQRGQGLAEEAVRLADQVTEAVTLRGRVGRSSVVEEAKAKVASANARIESDWSKQRLEESRRSLAVLWGGNGTGIGLARDMLDSAAPPPPFDTLIGYLGDHPALARFKAELAHVKANVDLEKANGLPDLTLSGGYRRLVEPGADAFVAGVSLPIPLLNRNQGRILEARQRMAKLEKQRKTAELELQGRLSAVYKTALMTHSEIEILNTSVLPSVKTAFESATEGFRQGRYGFLEVLDAQKNLVASRAQHLRATAEYHRALAELETITGRPLTPQPPSLERKR